MSQFNFPRINFHGSVLLDMPTANNGQFAPLDIYNQDEGLPYMPPRINLDKEAYTYVTTQLPQLPVKGNAQDGYYVPIDVITSPEEFQAWAMAPLGQYGPDAAYYKLYDHVKIWDQQPGYWNFYGDMSIFAKDIQITGIQLHEAGSDVVTYTPENQSGCPPVLAAMLDGQLSFHEDFFNPDSRTTGVMVDVDSEGQTCTQMFIEKAGVYSNKEGSNRTFFQGRPCKSTFSWMSLYNVLNWHDTNLSIVPMSGSASFYSTIDLAQCDPELQAILNQYAGIEVKSLFMKILVHQVYESRNPDYAKMPTQTVGNNHTNIPKNPAEVSFTGSICPWIPGDMTTNSISRILKNPQNNQVKVNTQHGMLIPTPFGSNTPLPIADTMQFAPALLHVDSQKNILSLDLSNTISAVGNQEGEFTPWAGKTTVKPFTSYESYDFETMELNFLPDGSSVPSQVASFDHASYYNMTNFLATGGMFDISIPAGSNYQNGEFHISNNGYNVMIEDSYLILTDQQGTYAEQNQVPSNLYMSDGLPKEPILIRAFHRGQPIPAASPVNCTVQAISMQQGTISNSIIQIYDKMPFEYPVDKDGCMAYGFGVTPNQILKHFTRPELFYWLTNGYFLTTRVLSAEPQLAPYLNGSEPVTWDVVRDNVLATFQTVVPIMSVVLPFEENVWSDPQMLRTILMLTDESSWNQFMYMPITREMSATQRQVLQKWANQQLNNA